MRCSSGSLYIVLPCLALLLFSPLARSQAAPVYDFDPDLRNQVRTTQPGLRAELIRVMPREAANDSDFRATVKTRDRHGTPRVQTRNLRLRLPNAKAMLLLCTRNPVACAASSAVMGALALSGYDFSVNEDTGELDIGFDSDPITGELTAISNEVRQFPSLTGGSPVSYVVQVGHEQGALINKTSSTWTVLGPVLELTTSSAINISDYPISPEGNHLITEYGAQPAASYNRYVNDYVEVNGQYRPEYAFYRPYFVPIPESGVITIPQFLSDPEIRTLFRENPDLCQYVIGSWGDCFEPLEATEDGEILPEPLPQSTPQTDSSSSSSQFEDDIDELEDESVVFEIDEVDLFSQFTSSLNDAASNRWLPTQCPQDRVIQAPNDISINFPYQQICSHTSFLPPINILLAAITWFIIVYRGISS